MPERPAAVLAAIAEAPPGGVLVHCVGGVDRTGLIAMLLLALAGVSADDIAADHGLSDQRIDPLYAALGLPDRAEAREALERQVTDGREVVLSTLDALDVEALLRKGGLKEDDLAALRAHLLEPGMHFVDQAEVRERAERAAAEQRRRILERLPGAEVHHVGATSVPGALTTGDVDLAVRVDGEGFGTACVELGCLYLVHQPENWTPTYASFTDPEADPPVGVQLVVRVSPDDLLFVALRDLLRSDPDLLAAYNELKREHEGANYAEYIDAKERFWEPVLARLRERSAHS